MDSGGFFFLIAIIVTALLIVIVIADYKWDFLPQSRTTTGLEMQRLQQAHAQSVLGIELATFGRRGGTERSGRLASNTALVGTTGGGISTAQSQE